MEIENKNYKNLVSLVVTEDEANLLLTALFDYKDLILKTKRTAERQEILQRCRELKNYIAACIDLNE